MRPTFYFWVWMEVCALRGVHVPKPSQTHPKTQPNDDDEEQGRGSRLLPAAHAMQFGSAPLIGLGVVARPCLFPQPELEMGLD